MKERTETKEDAERKMFGGMTAAEMRAEKWPFVGGLMYAMSALSDAQTLIASGNGEAARQLINRAKFFISEEMSKNPEAQVNLPRRAKKEE